MAAVVGEDEELAENGLELGPPTLKGEESVLGLTSSSSSSLVSSLTSITEPSEDTLASSLSFSSPAKVKKIV